MKRRAILLLITGLCLAAITWLPACAASITPDLPEPDYAGQITESILKAINQGDYAAFSLDFDESLLKALPAENFAQQFGEGLRDIIGEYQPDSKRFFQASSQAQYNTVIYYAVYSEEPGAVLVQISFKMVEGRALVSGLYINSPKLRD